MQETLSKFVVNNPYDFTKYIDCNPEYENYNHSGLKWTQLVYESMEKFQDDHAMKRGKIYKLHLKEPEKIEEIRNNVLRYKTVGNKLLV